MAMNEDAQSKSADIDLALRAASVDDEFQALATVDHGMSLADWYARLLTTLTVLVGEDSIVHGSATVTDDNTVDIVLVTERLVITGRVEDAALPGAACSPRAVSRTAIRSLEVEATMPVNDHHRVMHAWPGNLTITASFDGLDHPAVLTGSSYDRHTEDHVSPLWSLAKTLRDDLHRRYQ